MIDFLVDCFNREIEGLDDAEVWIHTCWGNPNMQKVFTDESYANSIEIYLDRVKGDVWTIEAAENDLKELPLLKPYGESMKKKIAVGVVSHRTLQGDFPEAWPDRTRRALESIPAEKLILSTDCGFGRQGFNRHLAFFKTTAIPQGRNIVLEELGLEPRYVPIQDGATRVGPTARRRAVHAPQAAALRQPALARVRELSAPLHECPAACALRALSAGARGPAWRRGGRTPCSPPEESAVIPCLSNRCRRRRRARSGCRHPG